MEEIGLTCAGRCKSGGHTPVTGTCTGSCECDFFEILGRAVCSSGVGTCFCTAPNTGEVCGVDATCSGGGKCFKRGVCKIPMTIELEDEDGNFVPHVEGILPGFRLYPVWGKISINSSTVSAGGGDTVTISGAGFNTNFSGYKCRFSNQNASNVFSTEGAVTANEISVDSDAVAQSSAHMTCSTPLWNYTASESGKMQDSDSGFVQVRVIGRDGIPVHYADAFCGNLLPYPSTSCYPPKIRIREEWISAAPMQAFAGGGTSITINGYGFAARSGNTAYECRFSGPGNFVYTVPAVVLLSTQMICLLSFVARIPSSTLEILHLGNLVAVVDTKQTFTFLAGWTDLSPVAGPLAGGTEIGLSVYGNPDEMLDAYKCLFNNTLRVDATLSNPSCILQNSTGSCVFHCITPAVPGASDDSTFESHVEIVRIRIDGSDDRIPFQGAVSKNTFSFRNMVP